MSRIPSTTRAGWRARQPLVVLGESAALRQFDERLWTFSPLDFIPHCMAGSTLADETPVVLAADLDRAPHYSVLLNLGDRQ
ncbi:hypothetical protein DFQ28_009355 [Apophysomyces sp. BC1034]|nr:hypothetical protein DFQ28_009355 [Apophysomyces sp. BC1034]